MSNYKTETEEKGRSAGPGNLVAAGVGALVGLLVGVIVTVVAMFLAELLWPDAGAGLILLATMTMFTVPILCALMGARGGLAWGQRSSGQGRSTGQNAHRYFGYLAILILIVLVLGYLM
ncbi:MAG: hypothetical protein V3U11_09245 [Planctomycetota bacterium]